MKKYMIVLFFFLVSCSEENSVNIFTDYISIELTIYENKESKKEYIPDVLVSVNNKIKTTNQNGVVVFDSLKAGELILSIKNETYVKLDTIINIGNDTKKNIELKRLANEISWKKIGGIEGKNINMVYHPKGYMLATSDLKELHKLTTDEKQWVNTGAKDIIAPLFISKKGIIFSATKRSVNNGVTWEKLNTYRNCTCFDEKMDTIYAGTKYDTGSGKLHEIMTAKNFRYSIDDGQTWRSEKMGYGFSCTDVLVNKRGDLFITVGRFYLFQIWLNPIKAVNFSDAIVRDIVMDDTGILYAVGSYELHISETDGSTWRPIKAEDVKKEYGDLFNAIAVNSKGHVFLGMSKSGVWRSIDKGESWEQIIKNMELKNIHQMCFDENDYLYVSIKDENIIYKTEESTVRK